MRVKKSSTEKSSTQVDRAEEQVFGPEEFDNRPEDTDNLAAAMEKVAETIEPTRSHDTNTKSENETANKQVLIRATETDHERWKSAAEKEGISLSEFVRKNCNRAADDILDCQHPPEFRKAYPWAERCIACGHRFR